MDTEIKHEKCGRCKTWRLPKQFLNAKGRKLKCCDVCRNRYKCDKCDYKCYANTTLKTHIKLVHDKIKDFHCDKCDYKCYAKTALKTHIKMVHDKIKDVQCPKCDSKFYTNNCLKRHIKQVHDKIKDFECPKCDYKCSLNGHLKKHIKQVHTKIKDFHCDKCDYKGSLISRLNQHIKRCTGDRVGSSGEVKIKETLESMNIKYQYETSYKVKDTRLLKWDFILTEYDTPIFIEYDGKQHFEPATFGGMSKERAIKAFEKQKKHDEIKNNFCKENDYLLLRIKYTEFGNIPDILTKFMVDNTDWGDETESDSDNESD